MRGWVWVEREIKKMEERRERWIRETGRGREREGEREREREKGNERERVGE